MRRWLAALAAIAAPLGAQRAGVLRQVAVPHAYYWREMYVPQVTSGPSGAAWSPDGRELVYSMQGSLWRQTIGDSVATQLTDGPGYDYQPDWSPDGRFVAFARYDHDAIELQLLELASGQVTALTSNGAVNVEPRWSPDGQRLAYVSSAFQGRWHVYVVPVTAGRPGTAVRITEDHDSGLPRYYYSKWDHYLSPTWSPDGRELILVSNRGHIHGSGGFWRLAADSGAPMRELRYEETTWKARPDWSPDGKRVVYASYLGRQWHQLWLMTSEGGDVVPITYGEFDATAPRWSRDGNHIAFISNETGNTSLWVLDVLGGARRRVDARVRRYRGPVGRLHIVVSDARYRGTDQLIMSPGAGIPARVTVTGPDGRGYAPDDAWRHADEAFDRSERPFEITYFHTSVAGRADVVVPEGRIVVTVSRGPEYRVVRDTVAVRAGATDTLRVVMTRLEDLPASGWWSGDLHVHMNYGGAYRNTPPHLAEQARAEDLHVVENLIVNKEQRIPDINYFRVGPDPVSRPGWLLMHGQEFHTSYWGHSGILGATSHYLIPEYAAYPNTPFASPYPTNAAVADMAHAQGALYGYVHPFDDRPDPADTTQPFTAELPIDVALGRVDYIEVMGYSDHLITSEIWYRLLNCGLRLPAGAGTDAFPNFASLRGPPGLVRVFVHAGARLDHRHFLDSLKAGRTFVTNGPLLTFTVGGHGIGDEIRLPSPVSRLPFHMTLRSNVPVDHVEIIGNGSVVASLSGARTAVDTTLFLPVEQSGWFVLRAWNARAEEPVLDLYPFASTSPIYVTVAGAPVRSPADAEFFVRWSDRVIAAARAHTGWLTTAERDSVLTLFGRARAFYADEAATR